MSTPLSPTAREIQEQIESNTSAVDHFSSFAGHRQHMTALALRDVAPEAGLRLCILGAGNCYDVDLVKLASSYREIHLVDVDPAALARARQPLGADAGAKVFSHAPLDLSGLFDRLDRWARLEVEPQELLGHAAEASAQIARSLPGPFDVVISACLLSQIQLAIYNVLSAAHPLFDAVRHVANLTHLRTLAALMAPAGRAFFATDVASNDLFPLAEVREQSDLRPLLATLVRSGTVVFAVSPDLLTWTAREDPVVQRAVEVSEPVDAWLWQNGPDRLFLVYALELRARAKEARLPTLT